MWMWLINPSKLMEESLNNCKNTLFKAFPVEGKFFPTLPEPLRPVPGSYLLSAPCTGNNVRVFSMNL